MQNRETPGSQRMAENRIEERGRVDRAEVLLAAGARAVGAAVAWGKVSQRYSRNRGRGRRGVSTAGQGELTASGTGASAFALHDD